MQVPPIGPTPVLRTGVPLTFAPTLYAAAANREVGSHVWLFQFTSTEVLSAAECTSCNRREWRGSCMPSHLSVRGAARTICHNCTKWEYSFTVHLSKKYNSINSKFSSILKKRTQYTVQKMCCLLKHLHTHAPCCPIYNVQAF